MLFMSQNTPQRPLDSHDQHLWVALYLYAAIQTYSLGYQLFKYYFQQDETVQKYIFKYIWIWPFYGSFKASVCIYYVLKFRDNKFFQYINQMWAIAIINFVIIDLYLLI